MHYRLLDDFDQVPVWDCIEEVFDTPVFIEDNIRAVAYAELLRGSARGCRDVLCLAVRSGIGLGIVIDGKLYSGADSLAGRASNTVIVTTDGPQLVTDLVSAKGFVRSVIAQLKSREASGSRKELLDQGEDL